MKKYSKNTPITDEIQNLFEYVTKDVKDPIEYETLYETNDLEVQSPSGEWVPVLGMIKKKGDAVKITTESGKTFHGEKKHILKNGEGEWETLESIETVLVNDGSVEKVVEKQHTSEKEFYDISLPAPHEYVSPNGLIHHNTFVVNQTLKDEGFKKGDDYYVVKGRISTSELYRTLFMHRHEGKILLFDDSDSVWANQDAANILKAALDSYEERTVSWFSPLTFNVSTLTNQEKEDYNEEIDEKIGDPDARIKFPSEFIYDGRIVFISNLPESKMDSAVLSRSAKIDMTLTEQEKLIRLETIVDKIGNKSVPLSKKKEIIEFLKTEVRQGGLKSGISMRTYIAAENLYLSGIPDWRTMLPHM